MAPSFPQTLVGLAAPAAKQTTAANGKKVVINSSITQRPILWELWCHGPICSLLPSTPESHQESFHSADAVWRLAGVKSEPAGTPGLSDSHFTQQTAFAVFWEWSQSQPVPQVSLTVISLSRCSLASCRSRIKASRYPGSLREIFHWADEAVSQEVVLS